MRFLTSNIAKIDGPVTLLLYELDRYFFLIDVDIGCCLQFKNVFGKYYWIFPKIIKGTFYWDTQYIQLQRQPA
jgi:hypothetical protein